MFLPLSVIWFGEEGSVQPPGIHTHPHPIADTHTPGIHPQADIPGRRPLQRTVHILLECILVLVYKQKME